MLGELTPERSLIFRITHRDNVPWIIKHGLHSRRSGVADPNFVAIGLSDLIERRHTQVVPCRPGGFLSDYIPFYFTPLSMMAFRIKTGRGVRQRDNEQIAIVVASLRQLAQSGISALFTDRHASVAGARFTSNLEHLSRIDWSILQQHDFSRDNEDLGKTDRYQAEALVHNNLPVSAVTCIACYDDDVKAHLQGLVEKSGSDLRVIRRRAWYF